MNFYFITWRRIKVWLDGYAVALCLCSISLHVSLLDASIHSVFFQFLSLPEVISVTSSRQADENPQVRQDDSNRVSENQGGDKVCFVEMRHMSYSVELSL